jgi:very-short-patch-repair endonuclease
VYAVGHRVLTREGWWMAAALAAGPDAVLSHRAAAAHWRIRPSEIIEVTLDRRRRQMPGIRVHQLPVADDQVTLVQAIPVTTVPRTLFDLASVVPRRQVERALNEADVRRLTDQLSLADLLSRYSKRWGAPVVRSILGDGVTVTRSELEVRFLSFLEQRHLPSPEVNAHLCADGRWFECDCLWRRQGVIVELDGWEAHGTAAAFERDRARDRLLQSHGWRLIRVTWHQPHEQPDALAYDLRRLLNSSMGMTPSRSTFHVPSAS